MASWNGQRLAGAAGIVFIVLTLIGAFIVSPPPSADESPAKFLEYFDDNRSVLLVQMILGFAGVIPAILFISGFWNLLRGDEAAGGIFATAAAIGFVLAGAVVLVATGWIGALGYLGDGNGLEEGDARTLSLLGSVLCGSAIFVSFATFEGSSALVLLKGSVLPKWLGWVGLVVGVLGLVGVFSVAKDGAFAPFGPASFLAFLSFSAYVVLVSVFMWLRAK
jgi:hypothetical protein